MGNKLRVVLSLITRDNDYQLEQAASAQQAALQLGVALEILFADNNSITQSAQILDVLQNVRNRADAILVEPASKTSFPKVAQAAVNANIAWVVLNSQADYLHGLRSDASAPVFCVTADNHQIGRIQGQQLVAILPRGGCVLYLQGPSSSSVVAERTAGMMETKPPL